jgi:hypothetical protein
MKKIFKVAMIILAMAVSGTGAWASTNDKPRLTQAQIAQFKAGHKTKYQKTKATHKVSGNAVKGANQVSPIPVKGDH